MASVLVIDDEADVTAAVRRVLERAGYDVTTVNGAADGIAAFEHRRADIVITDIIMPKANGIDVIKAIRELEAATGIIAISGGGNFGPLAYQPEAITTTAYLAAAEKAGANVVLPKPFSKDDLLSAVRSLLPN